jgi:two-component system capsular synthesis sensor histidine kinase RcsC
MRNDPRVLIIEDHDALRVMLFTLLRHQPLAVDTAATVAEALDKIANCDYALILLDMDLPSEGGSDFLCSFHDARPEATTFIIAVRDPNKDVYIDPQLVAAVLNKPLEIDTLAEVVRECAIVVPPPPDPLPCPNPAESDVRSAFDRGSYITN